MSWGGAYTGSLGGPGRPLGGTAMAKVTRKPQAPNSYRQPTPSIKEKKKKVTCPFWARSQGKVPKTTMRVQRCLRRGSRKKASLQTPSPSFKSKKSRKPTLFGHYHRLNEALNQHGNKPPRSRESVKKLTTSYGLLGSQHFRGRPETSGLSVKPPRSRC